MPRLPVHSVDTAPEHSRDALKLLEARTGKVINIYGEMAHSPAVLNAYVAMNEAITAHSRLDESTRQAIALAVAAVNGCTYCEAAHTVAGRAAGLTDEQMLQPSRRRRSARCAGDGGPGGGHGPGRGVRSRLERSVERRMVGPGAG